MSTPQFIDYQAIKSQVSILQILELYRLTDRLRQNGKVVTGKCPIHYGNRNIAFLANLAINCWTCFSQCGCSGDIIDFVSRKERVSRQKAARFIIVWFKLSFETSISQRAPVPSEPTASESAIPSFPCGMPSHSAESSVRNGKTRFVVKRYWEMSDTVYVPAETVEASIKAAHALPLNNADATYVPDSMNSDPETDVHPLT